MKRILVTVALLIAGTFARADTVALWLFDEQQGIYPSSLLNDAAPNTYVLVLGRGGELVPGRFGNALHPMAPAPFSPKVRGHSVSLVNLATTILAPLAEDADKAASSLTQFGLLAPAKKAGRTVEPMTWFNATFAAMFTNGEAHLRHRPFANVTDSRLNLGTGDWTVEFWLKLDAKAAGDGVILEIGSGPRAENDTVTRLVLRVGEGRFAWQNQPSGTSAALELATDVKSLGTDWTHCAFVHDAERAELRHYLNGRLQSRVAAPKWSPLPHGDEGYFSLGRDGKWNRLLPGALDEFRISGAALYQDDFAPPGSFASYYNGSRQTRPPLAGPRQLFPKNAAPSGVIELGGRKHLFLDDVLLAEKKNITFTPHPPRIAERVIEGQGWMSVAQDDDGLIRLYTTGPQDSLLVWTSKDGVHFDAPDLGHGEFHGRKNVVTTDPATVGTVFRDPNAPPAERWKIVSGLRGRGGILVYTSADGFTFKRAQTFALPFWAGSGTTVFYDDQRQTYVVHDRSDFYRTPGGHNERCQVLTEVRDLLGPWPFQPVTDEQYAAASRTSRLDNSLYPVFLDNGPLAPSGFTLEYPVAFRADPAIDPVGTDCYNSRAIKYPWAPDAYVAFPLIYFHYDGEGPRQRQVLGQRERGLGSGLVETQLAVSRDGLNWKRFPRPAYVPIGDVEGYSILRPYIGFGLVRRGNEVWQYCWSQSSYHSPWAKSQTPEVIHRLVQRLDGFVSADSAYSGGEFTTKPLRFAGKKLLLNIDTGATGFAQVGLLDENGRPIPGHAVDDCVYINGNFVEHPVEWLGQGTDVAAFAGRTIRLVVRMRGTSLYALQFAP